MFTTGNIITLAICLVLVILFRQMDRNNRTLEKVKKFGDKLKDELGQFVAERTSKLEESTISLNVEQAKAVAAVKRLESIREDIAKREAELLERDAAVEEFGKRISAYDETIKRLLDMTSLAETNLSKITAESDFADSLGKKLVASQAQLAEISSAIPDMRAAFSRENAAQLAAIRAESLASISKTVDELDRRVALASESGAALLDSTAEKLKELYVKSHAEAAKRADALEDASFAKLKEQATERLLKYRETIEERTATLQEQVKDKLTETQQLVKSFKADWQHEAESYLETVRAEIRDAENRNGEAIDGISSKLSAADDQIEKRRVELDSRLEAFTADVDHRLGQFGGLIGDAERLEAQLRVSMQDIETRVTADFGLYAQDTQAKLDAFSKKLLGEADALSARMQSLEGGLNELKSRAYDNVSEKLKVFEDDFFADLAKRGEAITAELDRWKANVDARLESLSTESESSRKDVEAAYALELKQRLAEIGEHTRVQTQKLEDQVSATEIALRAQITASDQSILAFTEQVRGEFEQAREKAALEAKNGLDAHERATQETLRRQEREIEARTKEFTDTIESSRAEAEAALESIRGSFSAWQARNDQQLAEAKSSLSDKVSSLSATVTSSIADLESKYQAEYRDFIAKTSEEKRQYKETLDSLKKDMTGANAEFKASYDEMTIATERRVQEAARETDQTLANLKATVQEIRETVDQTREKLTQKLQADSTALSQNLDEIDKRQKNFIAQTKIFDRADSLKVGLEEDIERIKGEISRLAEYRETMDSLEKQYEKVRRLSDEVSRSLTRFTTEKKRIDIIETDFNKLLALSDSIDKKTQELTITNDDLQQFQVQIRRFEEELADANGRFERLEKKTVVLDQTASGVDKAFEELKGLETRLREQRDGLGAVTETVAGIKLDVESLLENSDKSKLVIERISTLDETLSEVEKRIEKTQTSREWLARTETRLADISKQSQDQLKLLGDILKDDAVGKKSKGAPPIGIRENVVKLSHQGWKVDEIARALHLSKGEVELILELPAK